MCEALRRPGRSRQCRSRRKLSAADIQATETSAGTGTVVDHFRGDAGSLPAQRLTLGGYVLEPAAAAECDGESAPALAMPSTPDVGETLFGTLSTVERKGSS
ncbi:MAG: hypothetical protein U5L11_12420 [Arhodomonas sp.]|nr:hypothetical protein [Arhodomonas sp.]